MSFWRNKKTLILFLCSILILFIVFSAFFLLKQGNEVKQALEIAEKIRNESESAEYKKYLNQNQIKVALNSFNNKDLSTSEHYKALENITFYFANAYAASHDPKIREFVLSLSDYARKNFPKDYRDGAFNIACSDPTCGEKRDAELDKIQKEIHESGIDPILEDTITKNLEQSAYIPRGEIEEKKFGFKLVISQLEFAGIPKASIAAERLRSYANKKYSLGL